jgi:hypothetical protein
MCLCDFTSIRDSSLPFPESPLILSPTCASLLLHSRYHSTGSSFCNVPLISAAIISAAFSKPAANLWLACCVVIGCGQMAVVLVVIFLAAIRPCVARKA